MKWCHYQVCLSTELFIGIVGIPQWYCNQYVCVECIDEQIYQLNPPEKHLGHLENNQHEGVNNAALRSDVLTSEKFPSI